MRHTSAVPRSTVPRTTRYSSLLGLLVIAQAAPVVAQDSAIRRNQFSVDIGVLQGGLSYGRQIGHGHFSIGGGVWGSWEPWSTFEGNVREPLGVELFVRARPSRDLQLELGPSLLRYHWADDCSECTGTFAGVHAAAMVGRGADV